MSNPKVNGSSGVAAKSSVDPERIINQAKDLRDEGRKAKQNQQASEGKADGLKDETAAPQEGGEVSNKDSEVPKEGKAAPKATRKILRRKPPAKKDYIHIVWIAGHAISLVFGLLFFGIYYFHYRHRRSLVSKLFYRLSLFGSISAYSATVVSKFGITSPNFYALITTENFQYLLLAVVWLFTRAVVFKLAPYVVISFLHLSKHYNLVGKYPKSVVKGLASAISYNELALVLVLSWDTLLFRGTSGFALVIFLMFYWLRIVYSESTNLFFSDVTEVIDQRIIGKCPESIQDHFHSLVRAAEIKKQKHSQALHQIQEHHQELEKVAEGEAPDIKDKEKEVNEDKPFATAPPVNNAEEPKDVKISASTKL